MELYRLPGNGCNINLLTNGPECMMVDTGIGWCRDRLRRRASGVCQGRSLRASLLTHTHFGHAMNVARVKISFDPMIMVHRKEARYLQCGCSPLPCGTQWYNRTLMKAIRKLKFPFRGSYSLHGDVLVDDYHDLSRLGFNAYILHTPGHTNGSVTTVVEEEIALAGDPLVGFIKGHSSPAYAD